MDARWCRQEAPLASGGRRGRRALVAQVQFPGEAHGDDEGLWIMDLDVEAERRLEVGGEDLYPLCLHEGTRAGKQRLEPD